MKINLATKLTILRLALVVAMLISFLLQYLEPFVCIFTALIYACAVATDFFDGYYARKRNEVTTLGKFLDSIADKVLNIVAILLIIAGEYFSFTIPNTKGFMATSGYASAMKIVLIICASIIIAREFIISALRQLAASKNIVLAADALGKIKAITQYIAIFTALFMPLVFAGKRRNIFYLDVTLSNLNVFAILVGILFIIATIMTIVSGVNYLITNKHVFVNTSNTNEINKIDLIEVEDNNIFNDVDVALDSSKIDENIEVNEKVSDEIEKEI